MEQVLFLFEATPFLVPVLAALTVWSWDTGTRQKLLALAAVSLASAATYGLTYMMWLGDLLVRLGIEISLGRIFAMMLAHILVPAAVWMICGRLMRRGPDRALL